MHTLLLTYVFKWQNYALSTNPHFLSVLSVMQNVLQANCPGFIESLLLDYYIWNAILEVSC